MQHAIPVNELGPLGDPMAQAVKTCVHCGFCLPACPTYQILGEEMDSPRGRIFLIKEVLEGRIDLDEATPYIDRCLGCVGCVTACPSGVKYGELITPFRAWAESRRQRSWIERLTRGMILATLPYPHRFLAALRLGYLSRWMRPFLPRGMRGMLDLIPPDLPRQSLLPTFVPAVGRRRARIALLAGCAQQVLAPEINWAAVRVLARNGVDVVIPRHQRCCGALAAHTGALKMARRFARWNLQAFPTDVDAILTTAAGCGSGMHEYPLWLRDEPEEERALAFSRIVKDVSVFLAQIGLRGNPAFAESTKVAYHDPCHLYHAQGVRSQPRELLRHIENLEMVDVPNGDLCCGSAGTYNLEQPDIAAALGRQKADAIIRTGAAAVATGNIGCMAQIQTHLRQLDHSLPVLHTMEVLDRSYRGEGLTK